jgi:hypothetical protein
VWDFLGGIGELFGGVGALLAGVWNALVYLFSLIVQVFNGLYSLLVSVLQFLYGILGKVGALFRRIWDGFFKGLLTRLANAIIRVHQWLETHLAPIIKFLRKVRAYIDRIYNIYVRPILNTIQHIRQVLLVLRALHVKFAEELDRRLLDIEGKIARGFLTVRGALNATISWLNAATDPPRLARLVIVGVMGRRTVAAMVRIYTGLPIGYFLPNIRSDAPAWEKPVYSVSDLLDPARNPVPASLLPPIDPLAVSDFMASDPTPTDADLNADNTLPYFADVLASFRAGIGVGGDDDGPLARANEALRYDTGSMYQLGQNVKDTTELIPSGGGGW